MRNVLTVRLTDEMAQRLDQLASKTKRPKGFYIKEMLEEYLAEYEDRYLALERLNDQNARYYSTEQVEQALGL